MEFIAPSYVILSEAAEGGEVEESSQYDNTSRQIGAKILRLAYGSLKMTDLLDCTIIQNSKHKEVMP